MRSNPHTDRRRWQAGQSLVFLPLFLLACASPPTPASCPDGLDIYAAASLSDVLLPIGQGFTQQEQVSLRHNFASSGVLAQQILATPGAEVYLSANNLWMDRVASAGRVVPGSRQPWVGNRLVVVARADAELAQSPEALFAPSVHHVAMGDPASVPAGQYAKDWLAGLDHQGRDAWTVLEDHITHAHDVRAVLAHVRNDPGVVGIVYATDAATAPGLKVLYTVPDLPIAYPVALITPRCEAARKYLEYLRSPLAVQSLKAKAFTLLDAP